MGFDRAALEAVRGKGVGHLIGPGVKLLFVGVNPGLWTAAAGAPFAHPGNRFWPAVHAAGITRWRVDASAGLDPADRRHLFERGVGITNFVDRATVRADELAPEELVAGLAAVERIVARHRPAVVAVVGVTAYRAAVGDRGAGKGRQAAPIAGAVVHVTGNTSGLNAHETVATLAAQFAAAATEAGLDLTGEAG